MPLTPEELKKVRAQIGELAQRHALDPKFGKSRRKKTEGERLGVTLKEFIEFAKETGRWPGNKVK